MNDAHKHDPAWLLAIEENVASDREGKKIGAQILCPASTHAGSFRKLSCFIAQPLNKEAGCFRIVFGNIGVNFLEIRYLGSLRSAEGLNLPETINGDLYLGSLQSAENEELRKKYPQLKIL